MIAEPTRAELEEWLRQARHDLAGARQTVANLKGAARGAPWWISAVSTLGFPVVIALILLGMMTGTIPSPMAQTNTLLSMHVREDARRTRIMRIMCRHQANALRQPADECDVAEERHL